MAKQNAAVQDRGEGYVMETEYTKNFYSPLNPTIISFAAMLTYRQPVDHNKSFTYFELGCGNGFSTNLLAAANPHGTFYGNDFNPAHCKNARALAKEGKLKNVTFLEASFADLLKEKTLPKFDFITLHGIYSWVSAENRKHIVSFIKRRLKPGGLVYISYNCYPGFASFLPIRKILLEVADKTEGTIEARISNAFRFIQTMQQDEMAFLKFHPKEKERLDMFRKKPVKYLAHELFNKDWTLFYHSDVAKELAKADLKFAALSNIAENFTHYAIPKENIPTYEKITDPMMAQMSSDFMRNRQFRADIFQRGASHIDLAAQETLFKDMRFALFRPRKGCKMQAKIPIGTIDLREQMYKPILDALIYTPKTLDTLYNEIKVLPEFENKTKRDFFGYVSKLVAFNYVHPAVSEETEKDSKKVTDAFNRMILKKASTTEIIPYLVSPVLGSAVTVERVEQISIEAYINKESNAPEYLWNALTKNGGNFSVKGEKVSTKTKAMPILKEHFKDFEESKVPFYQSLGIL